MIGTAIRTLLKMKLLQYFLRIYKNSFQLKTFPGYIPNVMKGVPERGMENPILSRCNAYLKYQSIIRKITSV